MVLEILDFERGKYVKNARLCQTHSTHVDGIGFTVDSGVATLLYRLFNGLPPSFLNPMYWMSRI